MRIIVSIILIGIFGVLAAGLWGLAIHKGDVAAFRAWLAGERGAPGFEWPSGGGLPGLGGLADLSGDGGGRGDGPRDPITAGLPDSAFFGEGERRGGVQAERADPDGAVLVLPGGQRVTVTPPEGYRLDPRLFTTVDGSAGVRFLSGSEPPVVVMLHDIAALRGADLRGKLAFYEEAAERMRAAGRLGEGAVAVSQVSHDARGILLCMGDPARARGSGLAGMRLDRGLLLTVMLREGCGAATEADHARLGMAVAAFEPERWR